MAEFAEVPRKIRSIWPPLLLLAMAVGYTAWAQKYGETPRLMPTIVGATTSLLALLDLLSRFDNGLGQALRTSLGADFANREMSHDPPVSREAVQAAWMVGCIASLILIGFLPTIPLFIAAYMMIWGKRKLLVSVLSGVLVLVFVTLVFEVILDYGLYRGLVMGDRLW